MVKQKVQELAIFGGDPLFSEKLHVGRPNLGKRQQFLSRVNNILDSKWLSNNGKYVQEFEQKICNYLGVKHCIVTCNGTVALELAIRAAQLTGEVIIPSFTFIATAHALQWQEITPVFCDIDPNTHTLNPEKIEAMITPKTSGIMGVHLWGKPCEIDQLSEIAHKHQLKLLFDASHAFGNVYKNQKIGNFGDLEVFSFHATKFLNAFEGGAIATNNYELADKIRLMKNFGFSGYDNVIYIGTNGKMNEVSAAMGITNLENITNFININQKNYHQYREGLRELEGVRLYPDHEIESCNYQYIVLEINSSMISLHRDQIMKILHAENILARRYFYPGCHRMEPYRSFFPHAGLLLPDTKKISDRVLVLPTGTSIRREDIDKVTQLIRFCLDNQGLIADKLQSY